MSTSASEVVRIIVGIDFRPSSCLICARTSRPSISDRLRSSRIKSGRAAPAHFLWRQRSAIASASSMVTCNLTALLPSRNASYVSRTSPELSSTKRTSMDTPLSSTTLITSHRSLAQSEKWTPSQVATRPKYCPRAAQRSFCKSPDRCRCR